MKIVRSTSSSESQFRDFWNAALSWQKSAGLPLWPPYPSEMIRAEILSGLHFSVFLPDGALAGYFSLALSDELIWEERERADAIYVHRMCVNPMCKGRKMAASVLTWAYGFATGAGRKFVRMDTWADNQRLLNYYIACGFRHLRNRQLAIVPGLPPHYKNANLALFENAVDSEDTLTETMKADENGESVRRGDGQILRPTAGNGS
jgi:ribosomal protein S18 acetylase RimI-like enzyme